MGTKNHSEKAELRKSIPNTRECHAHAFQASANEAFPVTEPEFTFERLFEEYKIARHGDLRGWCRVECAEIVLNRSFAGRDMATLRRSDIAAHIAKRRADGIKNSTINRELDVLSATINYAALHWDWPLPNPVKGMSLKQPEGRLRWLTEEDAGRLIGAAESGINPCLADFIRLALYTGMRMNEMLKLEWHRVNMDARRIHLEGEHTKSGKRRFIPLNESATAALRGRLAFRMEHCPRSPWVFSWPDGSRVRRLWEQFQTAKKRAGIEDFRIHDLRHTFASWLVSAGVPLTEVRDLLGHASIKETERYAHLAPDRLNKAVAMLDLKKVA